MILPFNCSRFRNLALLLGASLSLGTSCFAQYGSGGQQQSQQQQPPPAKPAGQDQAAPPAPPVDPEEEKAYKALSDLKPTDSDKATVLAEAFVLKYPNSRYDESVYSKLTGWYFDKQEFDKMFAAGDKALALNPDDVSVLVTEAWVIPHNYDPNDMDADRRLDKAEGYAKQALQLLPTLAKPPALTDAQFAKSKAEAEAQAHSALGLVYFRRQDFKNSAAEMQKAVAGESTPDPVDLFIMGFSLQQLKQFADSAAAYQKCAAMAGPMQERCKTGADQMKKQAAAQPAPAKPQ